MQSKTCGASAENWYIFVRNIIQLEPKFKSSKQRRNRAQAFAITWLVAQAREVFMVYTVGKIAELLEIPPSTIRFYDKKGLLLFVERSRGGIRQFTGNDRSRLENILLLRYA